mgnify:CR=1 FL=1|jgi:hypothetical protein|tara:strand:+ start:102 stop:287 length:186 start_codon:yes stop_codon:yes gene_type:complete
MANPRTSKEFAAGKGFQRPEGVSPSKKNVPVEDVNEACISRAQRLYSVTREAAEELCNKGG